MQAMAMFLPGAAPAIARCGAGASALDIYLALRRFGGVIVDNAMPDGLLRDLQSQAEPWFDATPTGEGPFHGRRTRRFSALFHKAPASAALALHDAILPAIEALLTGDPRTPNCDRIQINLTQAIAIGPGEPAQIVHRDDEMFPIRDDRDVMVNVLWTLDPFTEINGATRLAPESHIWERDRRPAQGEILPATAPAGSAIIWLGSTLHGGGANTSAAHRRGIVISYSLGWLAQAEKLLLSIPPETARALPPRLQELIGYQVHRPNLGWIESRDPKEWLHGAMGQTAAAVDHGPPGSDAIVEMIMAAENVG